jgi:hypothetical protein
MPELQNEFSWSKSRHERFVECRRAYYYAYYGSWSGWEAEPGSLARELYVLKKLSSRWQWAGSVVHETLRQLLVRARATGDFLPLDRLLERTRARARSEWGWSRDKSYWREASRITGLLEHEYGEAVAPDDWKRLYEQVIEGSLRAFHASDTLDTIRRTPRGDWLSVDELDSWTFEGTRIWVAVDFAFRDGEGRVHVLDWKTGREREVDRVQVGIYALYAHQKWGIALDGVVGGLVYLTGANGAGAERVSVAADATALDACTREMRGSIAGMRALLADPARNLARVESFPQVEDRAVCRRCPFRRPCGRM